MKEDILNRKEQYRKVIGQVIREKRQNRNITQTELGNALGLKDHSTMSKIENGKNDIDAANLPVICEMLNFKMKTFSDRLDNYFPNEPLQVLLSKAKLSRMCSEQVEKNMDNLADIKQSSEDIQTVNDAISILAPTKEICYDMSYMVVEYFLSTEEERTRRINRLITYFKGIMGQE